MRLLTHKKQVGRGGNENCISVGKTRVSLKGNSYLRIKGQHIGYMSGALGLSDEGNLCLYVFKGKHSSLFKITEDNNGTYAYMSINSSSDKIALRPYNGEYEITSVSKIEGGMNEIALKKIN